MNSLTAKRSLNLWPHAIIAWFVIFGAALAAWVAFAVRQKMDLVRPDYYEEEVSFQRQFDRLNRTAAVRNAVAIDHDAANHKLSVKIPFSFSAPQPVGQIRFYRPSDAVLDFLVPLDVDIQGIQRVDTTNLAAGLWKVRVQWEVAELGYYHEQIIVLDQSNPGLRDAPRGRK